MHDPTPSTTTPDPAGSDAPVAPQSARYAAATTPPPSTMHEASCKFCPWTGPANRIPKHLAECPELPRRQPDTWGDGEPADDGTTTPQGRAEG